MCLSRSYLFDCVINLTCPLLLCSFLFFFFCSFLAFLFIDVHCCNWDLCHILGKLIRYELEWNFFFSCWLSSQIEEGCGLYCSYICIYSYPPRIHVPSIESSRIESNRIETVVSLTFLIECSRFECKNTVHLQVRCLACLNPFEVSRVLNRTPFAKRMLFVSFAMWRRLPLASDRNSNIDRDFQFKGVGWWEWKPWEKVWR